VEKVAGCSMLSEDEVWDAFGFTEGRQFTFSRGAPRSLNLRTAAICEIA